MGAATQVKASRGQARRAPAWTMPIAAFTMACILYAYSVTSIRAAKRNAQLHREADGGQLDMRRESLRRHGVLAPVEGTKGLQLFRDARAEDKDESENMGEKEARKLGDLPTAVTSEEEGRAARTESEKGLQDFKGVGAAVKKFKEQSESG